MIKKTSLPAAVFVVTLAFCFAHAQQQPRTASTVAPAKNILVLQGGLLIDGNGGAPVQDSVIIMSDGKIQSVGTRGMASIPAGATVIDATGKTIIPGLVDSHVHFRNFLAPLFLYWGVTSVGDMGNARGWIMAMKEDVAEGRIQGPSIMVAPMINRPPQPGDPPLVGGPLEIERNGFRKEQFLMGNGFYTFVTDAASLEAAISSMKKDGVDAVKFYNRMDPELLKVGVRIAHQYGLPTFAHFTSANPRRPPFLGTDDIVDTGLDEMVHLGGLVKSTAPKEVIDRMARGENVDVWSQLDTSKYPALIQEMVKNRMFLNPTLAVNFLVMDEHAGKFYDKKLFEEWDSINAPFMEGPLGHRLPESTREWFEEMFKPAKLSPQRYEEGREGFRRGALFVKEFTDAGGKVVAGGDTGNDQNPAGIALHVEMRLLSETGMKPMQVLQAATSWSMEAWGKSREVGTIEAGKRADLVVLNRNPLDDIGATHDISQVIQAGKIVDREALVNWKDGLPRPTPLEGGPENTYIHIPWINNIAPESFRVNTKNPPEIIINGENFSKECLVVMNDQLVPAKFYSDKKLGVQIKEGLLKEPGTYPFIVVRPGSGGATSNLFYFVVDRR